MGNHEALPLGSREACGALPQITRSPTHFPLDRGEARGTSPGTVGQPEAPPWDREVSPRQIPKDRGSARSTSPGIVGSRASPGIVEDALGTINNTLSDETMCGHQFPAYSLIGHCANITDWEIFEYELCGHGSTGQFSNRNCAGCQRAKNGMVLVKNGIVFQNYFPT